MWIRMPRSPQNPAERLRGLGFSGSHPDVRRLAGFLAAASKSLLEVAPVAGLKPATPAQMVLSRLGTLGAQDSALLTRIVTDMLTGVYPFVISNSVNNAVEGLDVIDRIGLMQDALADSLQVASAMHDRSRAARSVREWLESVAAAASLLQRRVLSDVAASSGPCPRAWPSCPCQYHDAVRTVVSPVACRRPPSSYENHIQGMSTTASRSLLRVLVSRHHPPPCVHPIVVPGTDRSARRASRELGLSRSDLKKNDGSALGSRSTGSLSGVFGLAGTWLKLGDEAHPLVDDPDGFSPVSPEMLHDMTGAQAASELRRSPARFPANAAAAVLGSLMSSRYRGCAWVPRSGYQAPWGAVAVRGTAWLMWGYAEEGFNGHVEVGPRYVQTLSESLGSTARLARVVLRTLSTNEPA